MRSRWTQVVVAAVMSTVIPAVGCERSGGKAEGPSRPAAQIESVRQEGRSTAAAPTVPAAAARVQPLTYVASFGAEGQGARPFNHPAGVAVSGGLVYVADGGTGRIVRFDPDSKPGPFRDAPKRDRLDGLPASSRRSARPSWGRWATKATLPLVARVLG
jgi:hypothetical protein